MVEPEWEEHYNKFLPELPEDECDENCDDGYDSYDLRHGYERGAYGQEEQGDDYSLCSGL